MAELSIEEKKELLELARNSIKSKAKREEFAKQTTNPKFLEKRGVFVSLHKKKELRGCIGYIEPVVSLWDAVIQNAQAAAFEDPRFLPVQEEEIDELNIEISILTVPEKIKVDHIRQGIDGVVIKHEGHKGTYLPQVWNHFKTIEDFLSSLSVKAGLPEDAWKNPKVELYSYQSETFNINKL